MAYASGNTITASDFNTIFADPVNVIWATSSGTQGYGQTAVNTVAQTNIITAAQWNDLISKTNAAYRHQTSSSTTPISTVSTGTTIGIISNLVSTKDYVITNYLNGLQGSQINPSNKTATGWKASSRTLESTITFSSAEAMRFFFNANGLVRLGATYSNTSTPKNSSWTNLITAIGSMQIKNTSATNLSGSAFNVNSLGYTGVKDYAAVYPGQNYIYKSYYAGTYTGNLAQLYARISNNTFTVGIYVLDNTQLTYNNTADDVVGTLTFISNCVPPSSTYISASWGSPTMA